MRTRRSVVQVLAAPAFCGALAGCGSSSGSSSSTPTSDSLTSQPKCSELWVTGKTLPEDYSGCVISGNTVKVYSPQKCASGAGLASYQDRFYAVPGQKIRQSKTGNIFHDPQFTSFLKRC